MSRREIYRQIDAERCRQLNQWGDDSGQALLADGAGEPGQMGHVAHLFKNACERAAKLGRCTFSHILSEEIAEAYQAALKGDYEHTREELIQVAAVVVAMIEACDAGTTLVIGR